MQSFMMTGTQASCQMCGGGFLFLFCSDEGDMKVSLQVINKKK